MRRDYDVVETAMLRRGDLAGAKQRWIARKVIGAPAPRRTLTIGQKRAILAIIAGYILLLITAVIVAKAA